MHRSYTTYAGADVIDEGKFDVTWKQVREMRDYYLKESDWRAMNDRTISQEWKDYRTALRDLPQDHAEANDAADAFPEAPEDA